MSSDNLAFLQKLTDELNLRDKQLIESEKYYRQLVNTIQKGICEIDKEFKIIFANPAFANLLGYKENDLINKSFFDLLDDEMELIIKNYLNQKEQIIKHEIKFLKKNEKEIWTLVSISFYFDNENNFDGALLAITDIDEKKRRLINLINKMQIIDKFFDEIPLGIIIVKTDGSILYYNNKSENILQMDLSDNPKISDFSKIFNYKDSKTGKKLSENDRPISRALQGESVHGQNLQITLQNNKKKNLEYWCTPIIKDKIVEFVIAVFRDQKEN